MPLDTFLMQYLYNGNLLCFVAWGGWEGFCSKRGIEILAKASAWPWKSQAARGAHPQEGKIQTRRGNKQWWVPVMSRITVLHTQAYSPVHQLPFWKHGDKYTECRISVLKFWSFKLHGSHNYFVQWFKKKKKIYNFKMSLNVNWSSEMVGRSHFPFLS